MTDGGEPNHSADFRQWLSFELSSDETLLVDTTFLTSNWVCIYGAGCPGVEADAAPELARGCCAFGAHFASAADRDRVLAKAHSLTDEQWQHRDAAGEAGPLTRDDEGADITRLVDGACIFLNRPDFAAGPGCALHVAAESAQEDPLEWKPDVCWQLPLRLEEHTDENGHTTHTLRAWLRRDWGEGGTDLGWWCTEGDGAYDGHEPVYLTIGSELEALVGENAYKLLADRLDEELAP